MLQHPRLQPLALVAVAVGRDHRLPEAPPRQRARQRVCAGAATHQRQRQRQRRRGSGGGRPATARTATTPSPSSPLLLRLLCVRRLSRLSRLLCLLCLLRLLRLLRLLCVVRQARRAPAVEPAARRPPREQELRDALLPGVQRVVERRPPPPMREGKQGGYVRGEAGRRSPQIRRHCSTCGTRIVADSRSGQPQASAILAANQSRLELLLSLWPSLGQAGRAFDEGAHRSRGETLAPSSSTSTRTTSSRPSLAARWMAVRWSYAGASTLTPLSRISLCQHAWGDNGRVSSG